jgi:hypothetical protein
MRTRTISYLGVCIALLVVGCAKKEAPPPPVREVPPPAPAGVALVAVDLGRTLNADKTIGEKTMTFGRTDTIYASVATSGAGNATVRARWLFEGATVVDDSSQMIAPTGPAQTEFHISKPDGWPVGKYTLEVSLDGGPATMKEFVVQ